MTTLFDCAKAALMECDVEAKVLAVQTLRRAWETGALEYVDAADVDDVAEPGRPARPILVSPREVPSRSVYTQDGRAALIHAIAHIEFNAINLALDAVYRFRALPRDYYSDWLSVADEEAYHFILLRDHLQTLGYEYGDFPAHNGLWEMACKTAHDPLVRMALVPRVLEARGLDVSPTLIDKLQRSGDQRAVAILEIIQRDEIEHVRIGGHWYQYLCQHRGLDPVTTFEQLLQEHGAMRLRPPFDMAARRQAGFSQQELDLIESLSAKK